MLSDPAPVVVGGRPATLRIAAGYPAEHLEAQGLEVYWFQWQPVAGLWATGEVITDSRDRAIAYLEQVRFDHTRRSVLPVRLTETDGLAVTEVSVVFDTDGPPGLFRDGLVRLTDGQRRAEVLVHHSPDGGDYPEPLVAGSYRAWADPSGELWTMKAHELFFMAISESRQHPISQEDALRIIGGIEIADRLSEPHTWPW